MMLTTVRTANLTPMMENGRITERSSHEKQLLIPTKLLSESVCKKFCRSGISRMFLQIIPS